MAITKIWAAKSRLDDTLRYIQNPDKVTEYWFHELHRDIDDFAGSIAYIVDENKTRAPSTLYHALNSDSKAAPFTVPAPVEQCRYVSAVNCMTETAYQEMRMTKQRYGKTDKVLAFHAVQSFAKGETTPEQAHKIGVKLAQRMWGDRFEVVVATHLNTDCLHNHFVFNSVSFADGLKYYDRKPDKQRLRELSDALCREYGLSVVEHPGSGGKHYAEWKAEQEGQPTWRSIVRKDVDASIRQSVTFIQFVKTMERMGYEVDNTGKYLKVLPPGKERWMRLYKLGEERYSEDAIKKRILAQQHAEPQHRRPPPYTRRRYRFRGALPAAPRMTGLRALYYHYLYKMGIIPKKRASDNRKPFFAFQEDFMILDRLTKQAQLLCEHKIDTLEQLRGHKQVHLDKAAALTAQRTGLYNQLRRCKNDAEKEVLKAQIKQLTPQIKQARQTVHLCDEIGLRSTQMQHNLLQERKECEQHVVQRSGRGGSNREDEPRGH